MHKTCTRDRQIDRYVEIDGKMKVQKKLVERRVRVNIRFQKKVKYVDLFKNKHKNKDNGMGSVGE